MIGLFVIWLLVTITNLTICGVFLGKALDKVDIFETEKMYPIEVLVHALCCVIICALPVLNIWFLGFLIYHRKKLVDRTVHWIIVASEYSEK